LSTPLSLYRSELNIAIQELPKKYMGSKLPHSYYLLAHCPTNMHIALPDSCHLTLPSGLSQSCCCLLLLFHLVSVKAAAACFSPFVSSQSKLLLPASSLSSHLISVKAAAAYFFSFISSQSKLLLPASPLSSHLSQSCCCLLLLFLNASALTANTSLSICLHFILVAIHQHSLPIHPCPFACTSFSSQYISTHCQYTPVHLPALHSRRNPSALTANTSLSLHLHNKSPSALCRAAAALTAIASHCLFIAAYKRSTTMPASRNFHQFCPSKSLSCLFHHPDSTSPCHPPWGTGRHVLLILLATTFVHSIVFI